MKHVEVDYDLHRNHHYELMFLFDNSCLLAVNLDITGRCFQSWFGIADNRGYESSQVTPH